MRAFAIVINDNEISERGWGNLIESTSLHINKFNAITSNNVDSMLSSLDIKWNYPWDKPELDFSSGLLKTPYQTKDRKARIAAFLSHYILWKMTVETKQPILILEHDAIFTTEIDFLAIDHKFDIMGINDPRGCTRRSGIYYNKIIENNDQFQQVPWVDDDRKIPQGLAGNSAYMIKPAGARKLLQLVKEYGAWPNDAIMCRQLLPNIGVTRKFYTKVQGLRSTTTL